MQVFDKQNAPMELGQSLGRGREAEVFLLKTRDDVVFKYYHSEVLKKRANQLEKKLDLMHRIDTLRQDKQLAWPLLLAYDENQKWIGYAMYRAKGVTVGGADPVQNLCNGKFPYISKNKNDIPKGCWHVIWTHIPDYLQQLFIRVFTVGASDPKKRPTISEWKVAFNLYLKELNRGMHTNAIRPALPKNI